MTDNYNIDPTGVDITTISLEQLKQDLTQVVSDIGKMEFDIICFNNQKSSLVEIAQTIVAELQRREAVGKSIVSE